MENFSFYIKAAVYLLTFFVSFQALGAIRYEKLIKPSHTVQAQILFWLLAMALAYLSGSFILAFINI